MIICAFDPGSHQTGCVIYDDKYVRPLIALKKLYNEGARAFLQRALSDHGANYFAIEKMQSYGMPVGSEVFDTCVWVGRFIEQALAQDMQIWPVYRKPVVAWLTGSAKGNDSSVCKALIERFGKDEVGRVGSDIRSAIAVALFVEHKIKSGAPPPNILG